MRFFGELADQIQGWCRLDFDYDDEETVKLKIKNRKTLHDVWDCFLSVVYEKDRLMEILQYMLLGAISLIIVLLAIY